MSEKNSLLNGNSLQISLSLSRDFVILNLNTAAEFLFSWKKKDVINHSFFSCLSDSKIKFDQSFPTFAKQLLSGTLEFIIHSEHFGEKKLYLHISNDLNYIVITDEASQSEENSIKKEELNYHFVKLIQKNINGTNSFQLNSFFYQLANIFPGSLHIKEINNHTYIAVNRETMKLYQLSSQDDFFKKTIFDIDKIMKNRWEKDFPEKIHQKEKNIINSGNPIIGETESFLDPKGFILVNTLNKIPLFNENGEMYAIMTTGINQSDLISKTYLKDLYKKIYKNKKLAISYFLLHLGLDRFCGDGTSENTCISERELDCLILLVSGKTSKEIARQLSLSPRTVESYIEHIKQKCHFSSTAEMIEEFSTHYFK